MHREITLEEKVENLELKVERLEKMNSRGGLIMDKISYQDVLCPLCQCDVQEIAIDQKITFSCVNCECHFEVLNREIEED